MPVVEKTPLVPRYWLIKARGDISQQQVCTAIKQRYGYLFNRSSLAHWERGFRTPGTDVLYMLAGVLGLSTDDVMVWEAAYLMEQEKSA